VDLLGYVPDFQEEIWVKARCNNIHNQLMDYRSCCTYYRNG
jgi:hypothetical protein